MSVVNRHLISHHSYKAFFLAELVLVQHLMVDNLFRENHPYDVAEVISFKVFFITLLTELSIVSKIEICDIKEICIPNYKHVYQLI